MTIKNASGIWLCEENAVKEFIRNGFANINTTSLAYASALFNTNFQWQSRLLEEEKQSVSGGASEEETKSAMWSLKQGYQFCTIPAGIYCTGQ